jgi:hypothetical protein
VQSCRVNVDCAACQHVALLAPEGLLRLGLSPGTKVLALKERAMPALRKEATSRGFDQVAAEERMSAYPPRATMKPGRARTVE